MRHKSKKVLHHFGLEEDDWVRVLNGSKQQAFGICRASCHDYLNACSSQTNFFGHILQIYENIPPNVESYSMKLMLLILTAPKSFCKQSMYAKLRSSSMYGMPRSSFRSAGHMKKCLKHRHTTTKTVSATYKLVHHMHASCELRMQATILNKCIRWQYCPCIGF